MRYIAILAILFPTSTFAGEARLTSEDIDALLPTIVVTTDTTRQTFSARGATTFTDRGRDSYGTWAARGGQYCSQWPPADGWACYDVLQDGDTLIWICESGNRIVTTIEPKG